MRTYPLSVVLLVEADDEREARKTLANALATMANATHDRVVAFGSRTPESGEG